MIRAANYAEANTIDGASWALNVEIRAWLKENESEPKTLLRQKVEECLLTQPVQHWKVEETREGSTDVVLHSTLDLEQGPKFVAQWAYVAASQFHVLVGFPERDASLWNLLFDVCSPPVRELPAKSARALLDNSTDEDIEALVLRWIQIDLTAPDSVLFKEFRKFVEKTRAESHVLANSPFWGPASSSRAERERPKRARLLLAMDAVRLDPSITHERLAQMLDESDDGDGVDQKTARQVRARAEFLLSNGFARQRERFLGL